MHNTQHKLDKRKQYIRRDIRDNTKHTKDRMQGTRQGTMPPKKSYASLSVCVIKPPLYCKISFPVLLVE